MKLKWNAVVVAVALTGSIALAQGAPAEPAAANSAPANSTVNHASENHASAASNRPAAERAYVIGPEDVLHIQVWKEADLTVTMPVRPDGKISLPLLNDVQAAGLTPIQLADSVTEKLKKFVANPQVTVVVTQINSKRIYLAGEVARAGAMALSPDMTVLQALSSAGMSQFANTKKIYVLRAENGKQEKLPVPYRKLLKGEQMDRNYVLQSGDTIVVP